jgi:hypothetical protein
MSGHGRVRVEVHAVLDVDPTAYAQASLEEEWTSELLTDPAAIAAEVRGHWPIGDTIPRWARDSITLVEER